MRILILATDIYTRGGIARYTATLATALGELLGSEKVDLLPLLDDPERRFTPTAYRILDATTSRLTKVCKAKHAARALRQAGSGYDAVFCSHVSLAPIAMLVRRVYGTPYVVVCYGSEVWHSLPFLKGAALRRASLVLADSRFTADELAQVNRVPEAEIKLLLNAIPDDLVCRLVSPDSISSCNVRHRSPAASSAARSKALDCGGSLLLSVGSLSTEHAYKGVDTVIEALPRILKAAPDTHYRVAGDGDNRPNLEQLAVRNGVSEQVTFTGEVTDTELAEFYRACDVFILPSRASRAHESRKSRAEGEGFGRVYVEAALAGKPVVGSLDAGAAEAVLDGRTGLLVDPRSIDEVASAAVSLLTNPVRAASMGAEGQRWALENFTMKAMRSQLENILRLVVGSLLGVVHSQSSVSCGAASTPFSDAMP